MDKYTVEVPDAGWVRENIAPWMSGRIEMGAARVAAYIATDDPSRRVGVSLVSLADGVEVEAAWYEDHVTEHDPNTGRVYEYWVEGPGRPDVALDQETLPAAAARTGVPYTTLVSAAQDGRLPAAKYGERAWMSRRADVDAFKTAWEQRREVRGPRDYPPGTRVSVVDSLTGEWMDGVVVSQWRHRHNRDVSEGAIVRLDADGREVEAVDEYMERLP